jgi:hypothetical protein
MMTSLPKTTSVMDTCTRRRAEAAAYADCTKSQMMAMLGWTDPKMPAL